MPLLAVNHHYFREEAPGQGIYPTLPDALVKQLQVIRQNWRIGNELDLIKYCDGEIQANDNVCLLTFDDGLKEQIDAIKFLDKYDSTALCFVSTAPIVNHKMLDVHKLHMIRSCFNDEELAKSLEQKFTFTSYDFDDDLLAIQYRYDSTVSRRVKYFLNFVLEKEAKDVWISEIFTEMFGCEKEACQKLYMDSDDLKYLAKRHILGTHAHQHLPLATLSDDESRQEIMESLDIIETLSGKVVEGISYPYGGKSAVSDKVFSIAGECGLKYGFTMERGINKKVNNPLSLMRIDTNDVAEWNMKQ